MISSKAADSELHLEHFFWGGEGECVKVYFHQTLALNKIYPRLLLSLSGPIRLNSIILSHEAIFQTLQVGPKSEPRELNFSSSSLTLRERMFFQRGVAAATCSFQLNC